MRFKRRKHLYHLSLYPYTHRPQYYITVNKCDCKLNRTDWEIDLLGRKEEDRAPHPTPVDALSAMMSTHKGDVARAASRFP
jgi:hypothetical protein